MKKADIKLQAGDVPKQYAVCNNHKYPRAVEFLITLELQRRMTDIFRKYGYTAERQYGQTELAYGFDVPRFGSYHTSSSKRTNKKLREHHLGVTPTAINGSNECHIVAVNV